MPGCLLYDAFLMTRALCSQEISGDSRGATGETCWFVWFVWFTSLFEREKPERRSIRTSPSLTHSQVISTIDRPALEHGRIDADVALIVLDGCA